MAVKKLTRKKTPVKPTTAKLTPAKLTMGPVLFNWSAEKWRDFYFQTADETPVTDVYIGEVVCSKRQPFFEKYFPDVIERLEAANKKVIFSSLSLIMNARENKLTQDFCDQDDYMVEANDIAAHGLLTNKPHTIGPFVNLYNEETLEKFAEESAKRFCLPYELAKNSLSILAKKAKKLKLESEVQVFGRLPLALSSRCYHARYHNLSKDSCSFVCNKDPNGFPLQTMDSEDFLALNGTQTMSYTYVNLMAEMAEMAKSGVSHFRISPHDTDMVKVVSVFENILKGKAAVKASQKKLQKLMPEVEFSNGFYHSISGHKWQAA